VVFDHTLRTADRAVERGLRTRCAACTMTTPRSRSAAGARSAAADEAEMRLAKRFAEYNVWRNVAHDPIEMVPLGFRRCPEHRAARPRGLRPRLHRPHRRDLYQGVYNADHQWYLFPKMTREEAILIKCYDR
jgi:hypothetical protein